MTSAVLEQVDAMLALLAEGKSDFAKPGIRQALNAAERALRPKLDRAMVRQAQNAYDVVKADFEDTLQGLLGDYGNGDITKTQFRTRMANAIRDSYEKAYQLGLRAGGSQVPVEKEDLAWLKGARAEEMQYAKKFIDAVEDGIGKMDPARRMQMYVHTLDGIYGHGQVESQDDTVEIVWVLGDAKHCRDCVEFAEGSPYTKATLPAVPRDGRSICRCLLDYHCKILTNRGLMAVGAIQPGTYVRTHRGRWKKVLAAPVSRSAHAHGFAVVVGATRLFGVTDDHRFYTRHGWRTASEIARANLRILQNLRTCEGDVPTSREAEPLLLSEMLRRDEDQGIKDPILPLLREALQTDTVSDQQAPIGSVVLLPHVLPPGTPLYDLTVEDDESFIVEGLISHNSNCRCRLIFRPGKVAPSPAEDVIKDLTPKADRVPKGFRLPTDDEKVFIENLMARINFAREVIPKLEGQARRAEVLARKALSDRLLRFLEERKIWQKPTWAAGNRAIDNFIHRPTLEALLKGRDLTPAELARLRELSRGTFDDILDRFEAAVAARRAPARALAGDLARADEIERAAAAIIAAGLAGPVNAAGEPEVPE